MALSDTSLLVRGNKPDTSNYIGINSLRLTVTAIPEPSTTTSFAAIMAVGVALCLRRRSMRQV